MNPSKAVRVRGKVRNVYMAKWGEQATSAVPQDAGTMLNMGERTFAKQNAHLALPVVEGRTRAEALLMIAIQKLGGALYYNERDYEKAIREPLEFVEKSKPDGMELNLRRVE